MKKIVVYLPVLAIAILFGTLTALALPDAAEKTRAAALVPSPACDSLRATPMSAIGRIPRPSPDFALKTFDGKELRLSSLRGNVVLVNFWATWCKTCTIEMPALEQLSATMQKSNRPFRLLALSVDEDWPTVQKYFPEGTQLEVLLDNTRSVARTFGTEKFPETFIIDKEGNIRYFVVADRQWTDPEIVGCLESLF